VRLFKKKEVKRTAVVHNYVKWIPPGCDVEFEVW
jgi:hypothetical protein